MPGLPEACDLRELWSREGGEWGEEDVVSYMVEEEQCKGDEGNKKEGRY